MYGGAVSEEQFRDRIQKIDNICGPIAVEWMRHLLSRDASAGLATSAELERVINDPNALRCGPGLELAELITNERLGLARYFDTNGVEAQSFLIETNLSNSDKRIRPDINVAEYMNQRRIIQGSFNEAPMFRNLPGNRLFGNGKGRFGMIIRRSEHYVLVVCDGIYYYYLDSVNPKYYVTDTLTELKQTFDYVYRRVLYDDTYQYNQWDYIVVRGDKLQKDVTRPERQQEEGLERKQEEKSSIPLVASSASSDPFSSDLSSIPTLPPFSSVTIASTKGQQRSRRSSMPDFNREVQQKGRQARLTAQLAQRRRDEKAIQQAMNDQPTRVEQIKNDAKLAKQIAMEDINIDRQIDKDARLAKQMEQEDLPEQPSLDDYLNSIFLQ